MANRDDLNANPWVSHLSSLLIPVLIVAGFCLTLQVFYPGVMTEDARYVYADIAKGFLGDWQSPVMTVLWSLIDPIAPGAASMFLLIVTTYWLAFGLLALKLAQRSIGLALILVLLALSPPAFVFVGIIWRDVLFSSAWLLAATLCLIFAEHRRGPRCAVQVLALGLLAFGVLLRPNALVAAPFLAAYIVWPTEASWKRVALIFVPSIVVLFAGVQLVYYGILGAERQSPLHSILIFDLGGLSHFAHENQFPGFWTASESAQITTECYQPTDWGIYWNHGPCTFVMTRLRQEQLFGSPAIVAAWMRAITRHPGAYLQHRAAFTWNFLTGANAVIWAGDASDPGKATFADSASFSALKATHEALKSTPLFRAGSWLLGCIAVCAFAWRRRYCPFGAFALGVCGSATVYVLSFVPLGVALEFRYVYWAVLASMAGAIVLYCAQRANYADMRPARGCARETVVASTASNNVVMCGKDAS